VTVAHPSILALGYSPAAMLLRGQSAANIEAIISTRGAREPALDAAPLAVLAMDFKISCGS